MAYLDELKEVLEQHADPKNAAYMKKYLKDKFEFLGIPTPLRRELTKPFLSKPLIPDILEAKKLTRNLWKEPCREYQQVAIDLLIKHRKKVPVDQIDFYEWMIVNKSWWDSVDVIADHLAGSFFLQYPHLKAEYVDRWLKSENLWLQRSTLIFQLKYGAKTDLDLLEKSILHCKSSNEFFLRKAIGWALRQYGKTNPEYVRKFVADNPLNSLSAREALKNLSLTQ